MILVDQMTHSVKLIDEIQEKNQFQRWFSHKSIGDE